MARKGLEAYRRPLTLRQHSAVFTTGLTLSALYLTSFQRKDRLVRLVQLLLLLVQLLSHCCDPLDDSDVLLEHLVLLLQIFDLLVDLINLRLDCIVFRLH